MCCTPPRAQLEFTRLKGIIGVTDGNLGAHLSTLARSGYLEMEKDFVGKKPRTQVRLTRTGRRAFEDYLALLWEIVGQD